MVSPAILGPIATIASMPRPSSSPVLLSPALSDDGDPQAGPTREGRPETNKRLLLVSYHFPPDAEVGAVRAQKLVKYLPRYGWEPLVLTVDPRQYEAHDASRLADV